jgi:hypothetical protein
MSKQILLLLSVLFFSPNFLFSDENTDIAAIKTFPKAAVTSPVTPQKGDTVLKIGFEKPEDIVNELPEGYAVKTGEGRNGTAALFYERTDPNTLPRFTIPLRQNLEPDKYYLVTVWVRTEGIKKPEGIHNINAFHVECMNKRGEKIRTAFWANTPGNEKWHQVSLWIYTTKYSIIDMPLYLYKGVTGKIWYDDIEVHTVTFPPAIVLTQPSRLSFFGNQGQFSLHTAPEIPKHVAMLATVFNAGKSRDLLLKQNGFDFSGDAGTLETGQVKITVKLADLETKTIVSEEQFQLEARPVTELPKNTCIIDEYNRTIVNGKPFMPLGVFGPYQSNEKHYQRIKNAGFNCMQSYWSFGLKGNTEQKDDIKNVLDGLDLMNKYDLKLIFSMAIQYPHNRWAVKKWGGAEGIDAVVEHAVKTLKDHPALLAWYVSDEEMRKEVPKILALRQRISRIDSWHPVWTLTYRCDDLPYYGISGDVIGVDPYPISEKNIEQSIKRVKEEMSAGLTTGLPVWVVPQIMGRGIHLLKDKPKELAVSHFPTLEEMRAMALYSAMLGAKGFIFYSANDILREYERVLPNSGLADREWAKVTEMVKPLKELEPFILSTKKPLELVVESEPKNVVEAAAMFDDQGNFRIIIIGTGGNAKGIFMLPEYLTKQKNKPLHSKFGKTKSLGNGKYEFVTEQVGSDILE